MTMIREPVVTTVGCINEAGNLEISTKDKPDAQSLTYYTMKLYGRENAGTDFKTENFAQDNDFEMKFRYSDRLQLSFNNGSRARNYYIDFFTDSKIYYKDSNGNNRSLEADAAWGVWHTLKLSTRGNGSAITGTIYLDGKELITYTLPNSHDGVAYFLARTYNHIENQIQNLDDSFGTPDQYFELEYVPLTPVTSSTATADAEYNATASVTATKKAAYGESINVSVDTDISGVSAYEYYVNGQKKLTSASATETLTGLRAGTAAIYAKVICTDGREISTETVYTDVDKGAVASGEALDMSREYRIDYVYDGTTGSTLSVDDGYFNLNFIYGDNTIEYVDTNGEPSTYTGVGNGIGAGTYRIVVTAGNAEVYYNGQFALSILLPYTNSGIQTITYNGGITDVNLYASGVKEERFFSEWNTANPVVEYGLDFDLWYSMEFDKNDTQPETVIVYDGQYQGKLIFDERGITAVTQPGDYKVPVETKLTDTVKSGYYRLTVAVGLAQLFVDNVYINSFKMPYNPHARSVMRSEIGSAVSRMVSIKNANDVYYHKDSFEDDTEYPASDYWFSEQEGLALEEGQTDPFTQEYVTEGDNSYLRITDAGLEKPYYADEAEAYDSTISISQPVGDWSLNAVAINPELSWRAKADGTGEIHFIVRHYKKGFFVSVSYDFNAGQWKLNRYSLKNRKNSLSAPFTFTADPGKANIDGDVTITQLYFLENEVLTTSDAASPGTGWNDYRLVVQDESISLTCNETEVLSYSELVKGHGRPGFGVSFGATLCIDDVEYVGDGKASPGTYYFSIDESIASSYQGIYTNDDGTTSTKTLTTVFEQGVKDFYKKNESSSVIASGTIYKPYSTTDSGRTWNKVLDSGGHHNATGIGYNTLNMLSGGFMRVNDTNWGIPKYDEWLGQEVLDKEWGANRMAAMIYSSANLETSLNGSWPSEDIVIEPDTFEAYKYNKSNIASQLVQAQSGEFKGRIFMTRAIGGERYGGEALFYTDVDNDIIEAGEDISDYWTAESGTIKKVNDEWKMSTTPLTYEELGVDFAESKTVDLDDSIRVYGRTSNGFIYYSESFDGGDTWSKAVPSPFIAPRCSYGIARDPQNTDTYYAFWTYDTNMVLKAQDGGSPRNRIALAVSYDGMKTWQYVMDVVEFTYDFTYEHYGKTAIPAFEDHGMRVIDGVVYVDYDGQGDNFTKIFSIDTQKIKPLKRFTSIHEKTIKYTDGGGLLWERAAVLPKNGGKGSVYGTPVNVTVTDGVYDKAVLALATDWTETEVSGLSVAAAAELGGKNVVETESAYIISNMDLSHVSAYYVESLGMEKDFETDNRDDILNRFNIAAEYGQTDKMAALLGAYSEILGFEADLSKTDVIEKMCKFSYYRIADIERIYSMICKAKQGESALILSTVADGFAGWDTVSESSAAETGIAANVASVAANAAYTTESEFGTAAFEIPDCNAYTLNFDIKVGESKRAAVKWGNYEHNIQLEFNSGVDFAKQQDKIPAEVTQDVWYNFVVLVQKSGNEWDVIVKKAEVAADGTVGEYTDSVFENVTGTKGRPGFWLEVLDGSAAIRNVRLYTDTIIEVLSFSANNGIAQDEVEVLNFDKEFDSAEVIMNLFNDNIEAGVSVSEALTEPIPAFGTKKIQFSAEYDKKLGVNPNAKFHIWKDTLNLQPLAEPIPGIAMDGAFEDNFSKEVLDTDKWRVTTDSDGVEAGIYSEISPDEGGVLKLKKDIAGSLAVKASFNPQPDNSVLMFDFKADAMPRLLQCQWYGNIYTNAEGSKAIDRVVFYLQEAPATGKQTIYCSSTSGYKHYEIEEGCWYSLAVEASGADDDREYRFYLKKQGDLAYERLWSDATFVGSAVTGLANANSMQFYESHKYTDEQETMVNLVDVCIDNFKLVNGAFAK